MRIAQFGRWACVMAAGLLTASASRAVVLVNDTWQDSTRTDPASPIYSELGTNLDPIDGPDLESAWYQGGDGTLTASPGQLRGQFSSSTSTSSASWSTYFAAGGTKVNLANPGDQLKVTWVFTPTNVNATNGSQNLRIALVDQTDTARLTSEAAPPDSVFRGYAMFLNFGQTTGRSTPYQLLERSLLTSGNFLSSGGNWEAIANAPDFGNGEVGYASGTEYTFTMTLTRNVSNGLDINSTMTGGSISGSGSVSVDFTDPTPSTFTYDLFGLRPSGATTTAESFDTSLFKVEGPAVPEPASLALLALTSIGMLRRRTAKAS